MRQTIFLLNTILFVGQIFAQSISEPGGLHCNQPLIALPPIDPDEHVSNGDFEQFCPDLANFPFAPTNRYLPFLNPKGNNICESDVPNWSVNCIQSNTPDFYLKSEKSTIFPLYKIGFINLNGSYTLSQPVLETHHPTSQAFVGLYCHGPIIPISSSNEELINELHQNLQPGSTYLFSFWGITKPIITASQILNSPAGVGLYVGDGSNWHHVINQINISNTHTDSTTNDWGFYRRTFTIPSNISTNLTHVKIVNNSSLQGEPTRETYVLLDDVSIKTLNEPNFPTYIYSPNYTDLTYQNHTIDDNDNIYVFGTQINGPVKTYFHNSGSVINSSNSFTGSFIAKYDGNGNLLWNKLYPDIQILDLKIDKDNLAHFVSQIIYDPNYSSSTLSLASQYSSISLPSNNSEIETVICLIDEQGLISHALGSNLPFSIGNVAFDIDKNNNKFSISLSTSSMGFIFNAFSIPNGHHILSGTFNNGIPSFQTNTQSNISNTFPNIVEIIICYNNFTYIQSGSSIYKLSNSNITQFANLNSTIVDFKLFDNQLFTLTKDNVNTYTISKLSPLSSITQIKSYTNNSNLNISPSSLAYKNTNLYVIGTINDGTFSQNGTWVYSNRIFIEKLNSNYVSVWIKYSTQLQSTTHNLKHRLNSFNHSSKLFFSSNFFPLTVPWKIKLDNKELLDTGSVWPFGNRNVVLSTIEDFGLSASFKFKESDSSHIHPIPSNGTFYFDSKEIVLLEITKLSGEVIHAIVGDGVFTINDPTSGVYIAIFRDSLGTILTKKLIVL